jgi:hypothetical protein
MLTLYNRAHRDKSITPPQIAKKGGDVMKDNTPMNKVRVSDEVILAAIEMLGKVLLAFIASKETHD